MLAMLARPLTRRRQSGGLHDVWRKTLFIGCALLAAWLMLAVVARGAGCPPSPGFTGWWQFASGASWPLGWEHLCAQAPGHFALIAGARMALGLGGPLVVLATLGWLLLVGWEFYMSMNRAQELRQLASELVPSLHAIVRKHHPEASADTFERELREMKSTAAAIVAGYAEDLDRVDQRQQKSAQPGL
jgi:hypothetical protein